MYQGTQCPAANRGSYLRVGGGSSTFALHFCFALSSAGRAHASVYHSGGASRRRALG